jgi:hypothetical protein
MTITAFKTVRGPDGTEWLREQLYTPRQAMSLMGVSAPTLYKWEREERLRVVRIFGDGRTKVWYVKDDLLTLKQTWVRKRGKGHDPRSALSAELELGERTARAYAMFRASRALGEKEPDISAIVEECSLPLWVVHDLFKTWKRRPSDVAAESRHLKAVADAKEREERAELRHERERWREEFEPMRLKLREAEARAREAEAKLRQLEIKTGAKVDGD